MVDGKVLIADYKVTSPGDAERVLAMLKSVQNERGRFP
jgi:hypothetical protein